MKISMLSDFIMDVKNWIYNWDVITFAIVTIIIVLLMSVSLISFIKAIMKDKGKFKVFQLIFLALLIAMLVIILIIRV